MEPNEQYLMALDRYLERHLKPEVRVLRVQEIRTHLTMDQGDRQAQGLDADTAAREARRALGSPEVLARQMVRQARGYDSAPAWHLTLACGIALTLVMFANYWVSPLNPYLPAWILGGLHWLQPLALIYFGFLVVRTQRWLVWPMAGWMVVAALCLGTLNLIRLTPLEPSRDTDRAALVVNARMVVAEQGTVNDWRLGHAPSDVAPVAIQEPVMRRYLPLIPIPYSDPRTGYTLEHVGAANVTRLWKANGEGYEASLQERLNNIQLGLAETEHPNQPWRAFLPTIFWLSFIGTVERVAVFAAVNGILLLLTWVRLRRRTRFDPLLA